MTEKPPSLPQLSEERLNALLDKDWELYNKLGEKIMELLPERPLT